jgi:acetyl esterase
MPFIDPALFSPDAVAPSTAAMNADITAKMSALPDLWAFPPEMIRETRRQGRGIFPLQAKSARAKVEVIAGRHGPVPVRIITPDAPTGVYLHIHGGGWMFNQADFYDETMEKIVAATGMATVSVDYRLAPEHPYPAGPDDCEAAALWLVAEGMKPRRHSERATVRTGKVGADDPRYCAFRARLCAGRCRCALT